MKIEYIPHGSQECPLIRIFDFNEHQIAALHEQIVRLSDGSIASLDLNELPGTEAVGGRRFIFEACKRDEGVQPSANVVRFTLTAGAWDNAAGLIGPFLTNTASGKFQWLNPHTGAAKGSLLLSPDGNW